MVQSDLKSDEKIFFRFLRPMHEKISLKRIFLFSVRTKAHISIILTEMVLEYPKQQLQVSSRIFLKWPKKKVRL